LGLAPKQYQRVSRLAKVLEAVTLSASDWAEIASGCGYYDQSHLIEDCQAILGNSPERFLRTITKAESLEIGLVFEKEPQR
jgi:methylphosphotriester-DNA--protein-cysteine methyltransferase